MSLKDKYCIAGVATTKFGRVPGVSALAFTTEAAQLAIEDAGLEKSDIDAVLCKYPPSNFQGLWERMATGRTVERAGRRAQSAHRFATPTRYRSTSSGRFSAA